MCLLTGTHLHDYNLKKIVDRKESKLISGDCFGYFGASGWWYLYDDKNVIRMTNTREGM